MRYVKVSKGNKIFYGVVEKERIRQIQGDLFGEYDITDTSYDFNEVTLLAPCKPSKIVAVGL
ncbi:MAG: hypothetical protein PWQ70_2772, partial [Clostridiales bacterium]|nr:hypothetical protein [Clostridiales bacterium]